MAREHTYARHPLAVGLATRSQPSDLHLYDFVRKCVDRRELTCHDGVNRNAPAPLERPGARPTGDDPMSTDQTTYAYDHAASETEAHTDLIPVAVQAIATDFEERYNEQETNGVSDEWNAYLRDIGGYANFPSYAAAQLIRLTAPQQAGLVQVHGQACTCQLCERPTVAELEAQAKARTPWPKTPSMTRQHFEYVARILAELNEDGAVQERIAKHFAYHLSDCNGRFDADRFVDAATR